MLDKNHKEVKPASIRPQQGYRLAYMLQNLPQRWIQRVINILDKYSQKRPLKVPVPTGDYKNDLLGLNAMFSYLSVLGKVYTICLMDKDIRKTLQLDTCGLDSNLFLKIGQGVASYLKMRPENKDHFKSISFAKKKQKFLTIPYGRVQEQQR